MYLTDGGGSQGNRVKVVKDLTRSQVQFLTKHLLDLGELARRHPIEEIEQGVAVLPWKDVGLEGEHLSEFEPGSSDILEQDSQPPWSVDPSRPVDEMADAVSGKRGEEAGQTKEVPHGVRLTG
jgi:hypothetical protein